MGYPTSAQGMRFSADTRWLQCPGGRAGDSVRCLAPLPPSGFHARILLDVGVFFNGTHGSPGARRAFSGVFSKPGWLHTRRKRLFELARSLDGRFGLADGARRGDNARFAPRRAPKTMPIAWRSRFAAPPAGAAMLKTPVFARSKRGYVGTGRGAPVYLCMAQAKLCKTIGRHAPDTQPGAPYADVRCVPSAPCANQKARAVMGVRAALLAAGLQRSLRLPWTIARPGRRRSMAACCCLSRTMPLTLGPSISRISSRSKSHFRR